MNQKLFEFLSDNGFTPMMSDYEEIRHLMSLEHCTATERAFLDEFKEKFMVQNDTIVSKNKMANGEYVWLYQSDFAKCNIKELVNSPEKENCPICDYAYDSVEHETSCQLYGG